MRAGLLWEWLPEPSQGVLCMLCPSIVSACETIYMLLDAACVAEEANALIRSYNLHMDC